MAPEQHAYSTDKPEVLAAYRETRAEMQEFGQRMRADYEALGGNTGALVSHGVWGRSDRIVGLQPEGSGTVPDGWRMVRGRLEPRRGKPGEGARRWLAEHQPPDVRHTLTAHGLPRHSTTPGRAMTYQLIPPVLFELDGTLWACYEGKPGDELMSGETLDESVWTPRRLSEFHAAREEVEARRG